MGSHLQICFLFFACAPTVIYFLFKEEMGDELVYGLNFRLTSSSVGSCDRKINLFSAPGFLKGLEGEMRESLSSVITIVVMRTTL